ncbi:MAG: hypothetical protein IT290_10110 [Deltaproteobacteria bacterium]|nr:hypothetical protein [Deltaproteobacteria bacterium]
MIRSLLLSLLFLSMICGCGKKGPPEPPELTAPSAVKGFMLIGEPDAVVVRWVAPETNASGEDLGDLAGFYVFRSPVTKGERAKFEKIADVTLAPDPAIREYIYRDTDVKGGVSYDYQVSSYNLDLVEGETEKTIRATFLGEATRIETF